MIIVNVFKIVPLIQFYTPFFLELRKINRNWVTTRKSAGKHFSFLQIDANEDSACHFRV